MEVQRIKTEGTRIDPPRNVERLWLAVSTKSNSGAVVAGQHIAPGEPRVIEVYVDRLPAVLERTKTDAHRQAYEQAVRMHEVQAAEERKRRKLPPDADLGITWNGCPEIHLGLLGYRDGLPPLESCEVVHPQSGERMDARAWQQLDEAKRRDWLVDAPQTPQNAAQRANEHLAATMERVFSRMFTAQQDSRSNKR